MSYSTRRRQRFLQVLLVAGFAGCTRSPEATLHAYGSIEVREVRLASKTGGEATQVLVDEGDRVQAGQVLVRLDLSELERQRAQADAALRLARAKEALVREGAQHQDITAAKKAMSAAEIRAASAQREYARVVKLYADGAAPEKTRDDAQAALELAQSEVATRAAQLSKIVGGARPQELDAAVAAREQAEALLGALDVRLQDRELTSPLDGVILHRLVEPGEVARPGAPLLVIGDATRPYLDVYVPEPEVGRAQLGAAVQVRPDALAHRVFAGRIQHVAAEAEFTPKNVQTADQRARLVFRVRIALDDPRGEVLPGMPAEALLELTPRISPAPQGG